MKGMIYLFKIIRKITAIILCTSMLAGLCSFNASAAGVATKVALNVNNDAGDSCYFDSNYCYTSANAQYKNLTTEMGNNYIEYYRLDYTNPRRKGFMYLERLDQDTNCFFTITLNRSTVTRNTTKIYNNILINADIMTTLPGPDAQMFLIRRGTSSSDPEMCLATMGADGCFTFSDGTKSEAVVKKGVWANYKVAINLSTHKADIYFDGIKIKSGLSVSSDFTEIKQVRFSLMPGAIGNMYLDNMQVTGLIEPFVDGVETPTDIYPGEDEIKNFLKGKVAFHGYSGLVYKDGVKRHLSHRPVFDTNAQELYVSEDEIKTAFGIKSLSFDSEGTATADGVTKQTGKAPIIKEGITFIPVTAFCEAVLGKHVYSFKTGYFIVGDVYEILDASTWKYQSFRADTSMFTLWNDIDFLNAFLQYERPDAAKLKADFEASNGYTHPRLLVSKSDFDRLRDSYNSDEKYHKMAHKAISTARSYLGHTVLEYKYDDAMRMLNTARDVFEIFFYLGYAWQLTGDPVYVERAYAEVCNLATFPDFNTSHIIDTGEFLMGLALAYDWLYDGYTEEQREFVAKVCVENGLKPLASGMYGRITSSSNGSNTYGSFRWRSNYNAIVIGGCLNAAIAAVEYDPDYCFDIIENCLKGYEYSLAELMPGGGWNESPSYWNYALQYIDVGLSSLNATFGTDYCLSRSMGMEDTLRYAVSTIGAVGSNNFHDMGNNASTISYGEFMYLSQLYKNKTAYDLRYKYIVEKGATPGMSDLLYYRTNGLGEDAFEMDTVNYVEGVELFSVKDTFDTDNDQFYFSTHFGTTSGYHQHNDCGTFVLDIKGQRWAEDLGSENYNIQNELGYAEYELYRKRAEGHNVMVINPASYSKSMEQQAGLFVPVTKYGYNDSEAYVIADMSDVYAQVDSMELGYYIDKKNQSVTMRNEFVPSKEDSEVYWFMHTTANITINGNTAYLTKNGEKVKLEFDTNAIDAQILSMEAKPLPTSPQVPEQNANSGYSKVAIKLKATGYTTLTVRVSPQDYEEDMYLDPLSEWHLLSDSENDVTLFEASQASDFSSFIRGTLSDATAIGGKESYDKSIKVTVSEAENDSSINAYSEYSWGTTDKNGYWSEAGGNGYLIISANVFSTDGATKFGAYTAQSGTIGEIITPEANRWYNYVVIYDRKTGLAKTVVNGEHGEYKKCLLGQPRSDSATIRNSIRLMATPKKLNDSIYLDDIKIYTSDTDYIPTVPKLGSGYIIEGIKLQAVPGLTGDSITQNTEYIVSIYEDNSYTARKSGELELTNGNVVVLSSDKNLYTTYIVTGDKLHVVPDYKINQTAAFSDPTFSYLRCAPTNVLGVGGKASSDAVLKFTGNDSTTTNDFYFQHVFTESEVKRYDVAVSMDVYVESSTYFKEIKFATGGHSSLLGTKVVNTTDLSTKTWRNVTLIHRAATNNNELYIDGVLKNTTTAALSSNTLRVIFNPIHKLLGGNNKTYVHLDNISFMCGDDIIINPITSSAYTISGTYISKATGVTVDTFKKNITKASPLFEVHVYNTNGSLASDSTTISAGMYVYVTEGGNVARQYYFK